MTDADRTVPDDLDLPVDVLEAADDIPFLYVMDTVAVYVDRAALLTGGESIVPVGTSADAASSAMIPGVESDLDAAAPAGCEPSPKPR